MSVEITIQVFNATEIMNWLAKKPDETVREVGKAIEKAVFKVNERAKRNSPVDTGRMRASISKSVSERAMSGEVVVGVRYGIYVHEGTRYMKGRPFLENAVRDSEKEIEGYLLQAIENVIKS